MIYASMVIAIIMFNNYRVYGIDAYTFGFSFGIAIVVILIPTLFAFLFWFILGRKEKGGTTTFNIVLTLMFLGSITESNRIIKDKQDSLQGIRKSLSDYKKDTVNDPDSLMSNYSKASTGIKKGIDNLINTSIGEEKEYYIFLKNYYKKSDSINTEWNNSHEALMAPNILNFEVLYDKKDYNFQKSVIQNYINKSESLKIFFQSRLKNVRSQTAHLNPNNDVLKKFMKGFIKKDSIQRPIFVPYIDAHIGYGRNLKGIIELLEKENGKWEPYEESVNFQNAESQMFYEKYLDTAFKNEEIIGELWDELVEVM